MESLLLLTSKCCCCCCCCFCFLLCASSVHTTCAYIQSPVNTYMWQCVLKAWLIHACCAPHESLAVCVCVGSRVAEHVFNCINITFFCFCFFLYIHITIKSCLVLLRFRVGPLKMAAATSTSCREWLAKLPQSKLNTYKQHTYTRKRWYVCI